MKKNLRRILHGGVRLLSPAVVAGLVVMASCSNDECLENKNSLPLAGFYSSEEEPAAISLDSISILGLGAPGDSVLHDSVKNISESYLPFRIDQESTTYVIRYLEGILGRYRIADTITFNYKINPMFVSAACGVVYDYEITSIESTHNVIDSVICPAGVIDNANKENLKIYFRVNASN